MSYKTLIGLEIHVELSTKTKMFCSCKNEFGAPPNTNVCEVCLGHPGALPVMNRQAVDDAIMAGLAFHCQIRRHFKMDRKKYFYSDLVKGYQISQDNEPICYDGYIDLDLGETTKRARIQRIHIEEDTGKSIHTDDGNTLMDFGRSGVPLIEIVSHPDMNTSEEAYQFLENLKETLKHIGVSDVKMEEGSLRCDVNINVVDEENDKRTKISEIKNLNSFKGAVKAIEYEIIRHTEMLNRGEVGSKETRRWDDAGGQTVRMRTKEEGNDYRYSVEGDIPFVTITEEQIQQIKERMPELPQEKMKRLIVDYQIEEYDAKILSQNKSLSEFFEHTVPHVKNAQVASNWILSDVLRLLKEEEQTPEDLVMDPKSLADIIELVQKSKINANTGKKLLREAFKGNFDVLKVVEERGLIQISDEGMLKEIVEKVLQANEQSIIDYRDGKDRALGYLVGQCMKESRGKGNPQLFNQMILKSIEEA